MPVDIDLKTVRPSRPSDEGSPSYNVPALVAAMLITICLLSTVAWLVL